MNQALVVAEPLAETAGVPRARRRDGVPVLAALTLLVIVVVALAAPVVTVGDPSRPRLVSRLEPPSWVRPSSTWSMLGTDNLGRDVWSRIAFGARVSVLVAAVSVGLAGLIGVAAGLAGGYAGGIVDDTVTFLADVQLSCPFLLLAIALAAVLSPGLGSAVIALAIASWPTYCRITRAEVLSLREREFVESSRALGASKLRIMTRDVLPNVMPQVTVVATLMVSRMIVAEASLSFLGLGVQPPTSSWGLMISESRDYVNVAWWLAAFPGLVLTLTVLAINRLGDWLRDRLDPRLGRGRLD